MFFSQLEESIQLIFHTYIVNHNKINTVLGFSPTKFTKIYIYTHMQRDRDYVEKKHRGFTLAGLD